MVGVIESRRTELDQICRHRGVRRLELFGSAAREDFTPASDLDFLVEFSGSPSLSDYLGLREDLQLLFGREVDLRQTAIIGVELGIELKQHLFDTFYHAVALENQDGVLITADQHYLRAARTKGQIMHLMDWQ